MPDQDVPAGPVADEAGARNMLGAIAGTSIRSIQIVSHAQDKCRRFNSLQLVARQGILICGIVEDPEPTLAKGQEVVQGFGNSRALVGTRTLYHLRWCSEKRPIHSPGRKPGRGPKDKVRLE